MSDSMGLLVNVGLIVGLLLIGWFAGSAAERRHIRKMAQREKALGHMLVSNLKTFPEWAPGGRSVTVVTGAAVIASDYLKSFLANVRNILGGELTTYETLLTRARREAVLRMLEQAHGQGYDAVCNVRTEFVDIGGSTTHRKAIVAVAVLATGTAYHSQRRRHGASSPV